MLRMLKYVVYVAEISNQGGGESKHLNDSTTFGNKVIFLTHKGNPKNYGGKVAPMPPPPSANPVQEVWRLFRNAVALLCVAHFTVTF